MEIPWSSVATLAVLVATILGCLAYLYGDEMMQPLPLALPHQPASQNFVLVTALYDLHRADRSFEWSYMPWFERTVRKMLCASRAMVVYCKERRVADAARRFDTKKNLVTVLEENYPLSGMVPAVQPILRERSRLSKTGWHPEWMNDDYILLQFSKFRWLQHAAGIFQNCTLLFWVDAGSSRFLLPRQRALNFPLLAVPGRISVQTVFSEKPANASALGKCMGCRLNLFKGTLFGGFREDVLWLSEQMLLILKDDFVARKVMDNEQAALALLYSRFPERFNLLFPRDFVGEAGSCGFVCI